MTDLAIKVEGLSKPYKIGTPQERYKTLRDTLVNAIVAPFRRFRNPQSLARAVRSKLHRAAIRNRAIFHLLSFILFVTFDLSPLTFHQNDRSDKREKREYDI